MKDFKKVIITLVVMTLPMFFIVKPIIAQDAAPILEEIDLTEPTVTYEDLDIDWGDSFDSGEFEKLANEYTDNLSAEDSAALGPLVDAIGIFTAFFTGSILLFAFLLLSAQYIYSAVTLQKTAQKLGMENTWFAWIPILNSILLFKMGDQNPYLLLLALIPIVGGIAVFVFTILATMRVCEKRGHDQMVGLFATMPLAAFILWGVLAWGKSENKAVTTK